jgi:hypothetical protein
MKTQIKIKTGILILLINFLLSLNTFTQDPPLVYNVEFTGIDCTKPPLPTLEDLPVIEPLTDPFEWSDGSGRDTTFESWTHRRAEIKAEIEHYEIGPKPDRPDTISASYADDTLRVYVVKNGDTLTITSVVDLPEGTGPFSAIIGIPAWQGFPPSAGSLPNDIFTSRDIAIIQFPFWDVMAHTQIRGTEPINKLYPDLIYMGAYSAWSWGVSRLIDGLELVSGDLPIDLEHLAISGCSFAGKMALFAGAFDERIALTISQESGGGGAAAWRVSETLSGVETLGNTSNAWFMNSMFQFGGKNVSKLPHDHHELMAMIAPRALLVIGNPSQVWLAEESGYTSCAAAKQVWDNFGISDRFGFSFVTDHPHCALPNVQKPDVEAFVEKFLLGNTTSNTSVGIHSYDYVIPSYWTDWWGKGDPYFPIYDRGDSEEQWHEAECSTVGNAWNVRLDGEASNGGYTVVKPGLSNWKSPTDSGATIYFPFNVASEKTYYVYARTNCPTSGNHRFWLKIDNEIYNTYGNVSEGWEWNKLSGFFLSPGEHTLSIAFRDENFKLDKICISEFYYPPGEIGEIAEFTCEPDTTTKPYLIASINNNNGSGFYSLKQNFPNPLIEETTISFELPGKSFTSLKVYSLLGEEIAELAGKEFPSGKHSLKFDSGNLPEGIYFYTLRADNFSATRQMIIQSD